MALADGQSAALSRSTSEPSALASQGGWFVERNESIRNQVVYKVLAQ